MRAFLFLLVFSVFINVFAQETNDEQFLAFKLETALTAGQKEISDYQIVLSYDGGFTDTVNIEKSGRRIFISLQKNEIYTLIFHKDGFDEKMVVLDTRMPDEVDTTFPFDLSFEIEMHPNHSRQYTEHLDFPVAIFRFYDHDDKFDYSKKYHLLTQKN
jgi:hypothetical protein